MSYYHWRERLGEANDPELFPLAWQDRLVSSGRGQFFDFGDAAVVVETVDYPSGARACKVYAAAGSLETLMERMKPRIEAWAALNFCTHCMIEGREGWRRKHPDYRHHQTVLIKEL